METQQLICINEALGSDGNKVMQFTKGKTYEFEKHTDESWIVEDDEGNQQEFWELRFMFKKIENQ